MKLCNFSFLFLLFIAPMSHGASSLDVTKISSYEELVSHVDALNHSEGLIIVSSDIDRTITAERAGDKSQADPARRLTEDEVDAHLRDPLIPEYIKTIKSLGVTIFGCTSRPPVCDDEIGRLGGDTDWLNTCTDSKARKAFSDSVLAKLEPGDLIKYAEIKAKKFGDRSSVCFSELGDAFCEKDIVTYANGIGYVSGYDKGAAILRLLQRLDLTPKHFVHIDDDSRAIDTLLECATQFRALGITLHLLHFEYPG